MTIKLNGTEYELRQKFVLRQYRDLSVEASKETPAGKAEREGFLVDQAAKIIEIGLSREHKEVTAAKILEMEIEPIDLFLARNEVLVKAGMIETKKVEAAPTGDGSTGG